MGYQDYLRNVFCDSGLNVNWTARSILFFMIAESEDPIKEIWGCKRKGEVAICVSAMADILKIPIDQVKDGLFDLAANEIIRPVGTHWEIIDVEKYYKRRPRPSSPNTRIPIKKIDRLIVLSVGVCAFCGSSTNLTIDHIHPVSRGGGNELTNLQCLCRSCNSRKNNKLVQVK